MLYKGISKQGHVARLENQVKKHVSQMSEKEIEKLRQAVLNIDLMKLKFTPHSLYKRHNRFPIHKVYRMIRDKHLREMIVEYNAKLRDGVVDERVLLRDTKSEKILLYDKTKKEKTIESCNLCVVISLSDERIITAYWNRVDDEHETINMKKYNANLQVLSREGVYER